MNKDFSGKLPLTTERLQLRKMEMSDAQSLFLLRSDERVVRYTGLPLYTSFETAKDYISRRTEDTDKGDCVFWSIFLAEDFIGCISLWNFDEGENSAEAGYELMPAYHGYGYMSEALRAVVLYAFGEMKLSAVTADLRSDNTASVRLLERCGFIRGREHSDLLGGIPADMVVYTLKKSADF